MAGELLLVNPRRRRRRSSASAKRRRKGGRRKMTALQRKYFGKGHAPVRRRRKRRSAAVAVRRHRRRSRKVTELMSNPRRRRRSHRRRRSVMRLRRNPMPSTKSLFNSMVPALIGAGGALAVDALFGQIGAQLPASLQTGVMVPVTRIGAALAVGWGLGKVAGKSFGNDVAAGAITVTLYDIIKSYVQTNMPSIPLARYAGPGPRLNRYAGPGPRMLGRRPARVGMGYVNAGRVLRGPGPTNVTRVFGR